MELYIKDGKSKGYLNWNNIMTTLKVTPFMFMTGGRGTGKTYGALEYLYNHKIKFIYLRRKQQQYDIVSKPDTHPYKSFMTDNPGVHITTSTISKGCTGLYNAEYDDEKEKYVPIGEPFAYMTALSTCSNIRGLDFSDVEVILYDEFIPEKIEKRIKGEADALFNLYETINRNRELLNKPPCYLIGLSNANDLCNPYYDALKITKYAEQMQKKKQVIRTFPKRGLTIINLQDSPISERKKMTALYKLTAGTSFYNMSIDNTFEMDEATIIKSMPLIEYIPLVSSTLGITIYKHKNRREYYVSPHNAGAELYGKSKDEKTRFWNHYSYLWFAYLRNEVIFEEYSCLSHFQKMFDNYDD